ncbi:uncharacterized protein LOC144928506 [Branchiostoma floridae x Branchiostoma belcheri]
MGTSESKPNRMGCACVLRRLRRKNKVSNFGKVETSVTSPSTPKPGLFSRLLKRSTLPPGVILVESADAPRPRPSFTITWSSEEELSGSDLDSEISDYERDQISGSEQDQISGSERDQISGSAEQDQISGSAEQDQISGSEQDQISGSAEKDQISGSDAGEIPAAEEQGQSRERQGVRKTEVAQSGDDLPPVA